MRRRAYLATAGVLSLAGCLGIGDSSDPDDEPTDDEPVDDDDDDSADREPEDDDDDDEETDVGPETYHDFEDLDQWEVIVGSLSADEDNYYTGSQSAVLEIDEGEQMANIALELDEPEDLSNVNAGLAVMAESVENPSIQLYDDDGDRVDVMCEVAPDMPFMRTNFGISNTNGDPDLSQIEEIQIAFDAAEDTTARLWIDDLHFVPRERPGVVMLQFDGGYASHHNMALPLLDTFDFPATAFIPTARIHEDEDWHENRLSEDQVAELADAGWTIASNGANGQNLTALSERTPEDEITNAIEWLEEHGYEDGARFFSYPVGVYNDVVLELAEEYHDVAFAGRYPCQGRAVHPHLCNRIVNPSTAQAETVLDRTAEYGGVTTLAYYRLEDDDGDDDREQLADTLAHLNGLVQRNEVRVITPEQFADEYVY